MHDDDGIRIWCGGVTKINKVENKDGGSCGSSGDVIIGEVGGNGNGDNHVQAAVAAMLALV